jgi:regulator of ribonuclease activity A
MADFTCPELNTTESIYAVSTYRQFSDVSNKYRTASYDNYCCGLIAGVLAMLHLTTDISDSLGDDARAANPGFNDYGARTVFCGPISTVKCHEDNSLVRASLEQPGDGRVLVVDGGASMHCALLGDMLATMANQNGWAGIIVNGCIRDSAEIASINIGVKARATHPKKSLKRGEGQQDVVVHFAGIDFRPGDYLYADGDGIVVTSKPVETGVEA